MDAEGFREQTPCPNCGSLETITYHYSEGFEELECGNCGYRSDSEALAELQRATGDLLERDGSRLRTGDRDRGPESAGPPVPFRSMKA